MSNVVVIGTGLAGLAAARRLVAGGREVTAIGQLQQAERAQAPGRYHHSGYVVTGLNGDPLAPAQAARRRRDPIRQGSNPKVVKLSFGMAGPDSPSATHRAHGVAEEVLTWAGLDLTVLQIAAVFHENLLPLSGQSVRSEGAIRNRFGDAKVNWISASDVGRLAAAILRPDRYASATTDVIGGSEQLTSADVAAIIPGKAAAALPHPSQQRRRVRLL
jgi:uncharacterized protein YbjT (DUF2867 family)